MKRLSTGQEVVQSLLKKTSSTEKNVEDHKIHPWRMCSAGEHWVKTHPMHVPPSRFKAMLERHNRKDGLCDICIAHRAVDMLRHPSACCFQYKEN